GGAAGAGERQAGAVGALVVGVARHAHARDARHAQKDGVGAARLHAATVVAVGADGLALGRADEALGALDAVAVEAVEVALTWRAEATRDRLAAGVGRLARRGVLGRRGVEADR